MNLQDQRQLQKRARDGLDHWSRWASPEHGRPTGPAGDDLTSSRAAVVTGVVVPEASVVAMTGAVGSPELVGDALS